MLLPPVCERVRRQTGLAASQLPHSGRTSIVPVWATGFPVARYFDGLVEAPALDDVEPADRLLGRGDDDRLTRRHLVDA
jgi:hypothetical protein